jgi:hypothetical protein
MSTSTGPQRHLSKRRRARIAALALSLFAHSALAALLVWTMDQERQKVGSQELDVELVAPRLATPLDPAGREARDPGRAKRDGESETARTSREDRSKASAARAAQASAWQRKIAAAEKAASTSQKQDAELRDKRTQEQAEQRAARTEQQLKKQRRKKQAKRVDDAKLKSIELSEDPTASLARLQQLAFQQQTQLAVATELPDGPSLNHLVDDVRQERAARKARRKHAQAAKQQQHAAMERRFRALAHRTEVLASVSLTGGRAIIGESATTGVLRAGGSARRGGKTPRYGLKFYLSGRRVKHSKVVRPPELVKAPRLKCKVTSLSITPATVRMLVEKNGKVGHTYLKHSSGNTVFDRCSIKHAKAMVFRPGVDELGEPLDVWINVRVEPSTLTARAY